MGNEQESPHKKHTTNMVLRLVNTNERPEPEETVIRANSTALNEEFFWLASLIKSRMNEYESLGGSYDIDTPRKPVHELCSIPQLLPSSFRDFILEHELGIMERVLIVVTLAAHCAPEVFIPLFIHDDAVHYLYPPWGGKRIEDNTIVPTLKTVLFLLSGNTQNLKTPYEYALNEHHSLIQKQIIEFRTYVNTPHPTLDPVVVLEPAYKDYFLTGIRPRLDYGAHFPADILETEQTFDDLVVSESLRAEIELIPDYILTREKLFSLKNSYRRFSPGYIVMFYGPPGTGKSMTASLIGKTCGLPVYRVKLSMAISKYIGETEKNLELVFSRLEGKDVILFFDEADALFGKRTEITDAKDRYANQEISFLLQRIEKWNGIVILATNFRQNLDTAFSRRISQYISFNPPEYEERLKLWLSILPEELSYESEELPKALAAAYPLTGADITSVLKRACIVVLKNNETVVTKKILNPLIRDECMKSILRQTYKPL